MDEHRLLFRCRVCDAVTEAGVHTLREMMYGTRESFDYRMCGDCGCLQIDSIPEDLGRHYPGTYYSQRPRKEPPSRKGVAGWVARRYCTRLALRPDAPATALLRWLLPQPWEFSDVAYILRAAALRSAAERILDVGCGASPFRLAAIRRCGFERVEGIDPFIGADVDYYGIAVRKCQLEEVAGSFGLVMFHHSLEHVVDPVATLRHAAGLLRPGGACLVRVPVVGTYFWRRFGPHWVELDAPRHLHLFSLQAMAVLAMRAGFEVESTQFDSGLWELLRSHQYARDIPLTEALPDDLQQANPEREEQARWVEQLNRVGDAGRACFILRKR